MMMLKRAEVILTVLLVALNCGAGVISFVLPSCVGHVARPSQLIIGRSHGYKTQCPAVSETAAQDTSGSPLSGNPLPPKDETFSPQGSLFELLEAPVPPQSCGRFDGVGKKTGGIWRSRVLGFMPSTVVAWPLADKWVIQEEAAGNLIPSYPKSLKELFGPKALTSLILPSRRHAALTTAFDCVLSPRAIAKLLPAIEAAMDKIVVGWEKAAALEQEITMLDDIKRFTLETICGGLLGDYATETVREEISCLLPVFANGVISIPKRFRWPLNLLPMLRYRQSLDAREGLVRVLQEVVQRRKYDIEHANEDGDGQHAGVVDGFLRIRKEQQEGTQNPDPEVDDDFIVDNVIAALFGGYDTTAAVIARMVQTLGSAEGKAIIHELSNELSKAIKSNDTLRYGSNGVLSSSIFKSFPLLEAVFLESYRLSPSGPGLFRKVVGETAYNGYRIPAGESVQWNTSIGCRAKSLYPEPEKFCPARFLRQGNSKHGTSPNNKKQPHPQPFGVGVHMCRGRELAKLEMLIFFRELLSRFEFDLAKDQSFKGVPPANAPQDKLRLRLKAKAKPTT